LSSSTSVGKGWMQRLYSGLGYQHLRNFSWSNFISTWLLIKYKFIPTHNYHKEIDKIRHKYMASMTRVHNLSPSSSLVIMWGSWLLLTMSTANRLVLHSAEVVHFHHKQRKSSKELWTQPCDTDQAPYHTTDVWLHRDATRPLQRFPSKLWPTRSGSVSKVWSPLAGRYATIKIITHPTPSRVIPCPAAKVPNYSAKTSACLVLVVVLFSWVVLHVSINAQWSFI
jgi:hypothetical protein